ncbi:hypothetical protein TNCV_1238941 [Trichonephila clavipes]|nr:hypothetical protein TNCV_1238941 [Trichonephila clavipes]
MFLAGHPSQGCFGLQSHCAPCYFFDKASFYPSDFSFNINECLINNTCHPTTKCINTIGSFECECEEGYRKPEQEEFCEDINECAQDSDICKNWNSVKCVNLPGTYKCECLPGYEPTDRNVDPRKTRCQEYEESWLPVGIAAGIAVLLVIVSLALLKYMDYRYI